MKKNNKIKIRVNGKLFKIDQKTTLLEYIKKVKVPIKKVAIELNHEIIDKNAIGKIKLKKK